MKGTATVTNTTTITPVTVTDVKEAVVVSTTATSVVVRGADGVQRRFTQSELDKRGIEIFKDGKLIRVSQLNPGDQPDRDDRLEPAANHRDRDGSRREDGPGQGSARSSQDGTRSGQGRTRSGQGGTRSGQGGTRGSAARAAPPVVASTTPGDAQRPADEVGPARGVAVVVAVARDNRHRDRCVSLHAQEEELTAPNCCFERGIGRRQRTSLLRLRGRLTSAMRNPFLCRGGVVDEQWVGGSHDSEMHVSDVQQTGRSNDQQS